MAIASTLPSITGDTHEHCHPLVLVRDAEQTEVLGVAAKAIDYTKPETLDAVFPGVETLSLISSSGVGQRVVQHANVIAATKKASVSGGGRWG